MTMNSFLTVKWLWLYAGAALMFLEILSPGFVIFFFGLAAATVGGLLFVVEFSATLQVILFTALSLVYLFTLRRFVKGVFKGDTQETPSIDDEFKGRLGEVVSEIRPGLPGRVLVGDAEWTAEAGETLVPGTKVRVVARRNLTLRVEK